MNENNQSPLEKYTRQPKLYIDLPSKGVWYPKTVLDKFEELEVYSMTASDEMALKTPDGLYTGNTVVRIIQNCIPAIKDAWYVPTVDLDYILGAIRLATYGDSLEVKTTCKECKNVDDFALSINDILQNIQSNQFVSEVKVIDLTVKIRPLTYKELTELQKTTLYVQRAILTQVNENKDSDESKELVDQLMEKITTATQEAVVNSVIEVVTPDGESETKPQFIKDFLLNASDSSYFNEIRKVYEDNGLRIKVKETKVSCSECETENTIQPQLDYANFFVRK